VCLQAASSGNEVTPDGGAPVKIGNMLAVKVRYRQGVASQSGSESWGGGSNTAVQALTGERIGWVLSREKETNPECRESLRNSKATLLSAKKASAKQAPRGQRPRACAETY
jgi:hypothetical protein